MLQSMGSQRAGHNLVIEEQQYRFFRQGSTHLLQQSAEVLLKGSLILFHNENLVHTSWKDENSLLPLKNRVLKHQMGSV